MYNSTGGPNWSFNDGWLTDNPNWYGVNITWSEATSSHVTGLYLNYNGLTGTIPSSLGNLTELQNLDLSSNQLTGTIPTELGNLTSLEWLNLDDNQLTGTIPTQLGNLTNLEDLDLGYNQLTSGTIPTWLQNLTNLQWLGLCSDQLTGTIPTWFGNLTNLEWLDLSDNQLTGTIPSSLGNLTSLIGLYLGDNHLTGTIPSALGNLTELQNLDLSSNQLTGTIPTELGNLTSLEWLNLDDNQLTGTIPTQLGNLTNLEDLDLGYNQLTSGTIPTWLQNLTNLQWLGLCSDQLTGTIPTWFGNLTNLEWLDLSDNQLTGTIPSSLGNLTSLIGLYLGDNHLTGTIPSALGSLDQLWYLGLGGNQLSGTIPSSLANLTSLELLELNGNQLTGEIPASLADLADLEPNCGWTDLSYNGLSASGSTLPPFLSTEFPGWDQTQTIPPTNVSAISRSAGSVKVFWTPILYTSDTGYYEVGISPASGGPYTPSGRTGNKSATSIIVTGLPVGSMQYVVVRTATLPNANNQNTLTSLWSTEVPVAVSDSTGGNANVVYVDCDSPTDGPGTNWSNAFRTVTAGLNAATSSGEVWVAKGTYTECITLTAGVGLYGGFAGTETALSQRNWNTNITILDGNQSGTVVTVPSNATQTMCIDGFTIRNGNGYYGGGIYCYYSSPTISNNTITGNSSADGGGGIYCDSSSPTITNNTIANNSTTKDGGGVECDSGSPIITKNTITANSAGDIGGGISAEDYCAATISNNIITGNSSSTAGGGISAWECSPTIADNTITGNSAYYGGGGISCDYYASPAITNNTITGNSSTYYGAIASIIATYYGGGILCIDSSSPVISNNIVVFNSSGMYNGAMTGDSPGTPDLENNDVYGNTAYNYAGITDPTGVSGNISADPLFVNPTGGNYRLSAGSPCIDTGTNTVVMSPPFLTNSSGVIIDLDGNPRIADGTVDMGAYEYFLDVTITSPTTASTYITNSSTIALSGTASSAAGVTQVTWSNSAGGNGTCVGTTSWSAIEIALQNGNNVITVTATDSAGNTGSAILTVIRTTNSLGIPDSEYDALLDLYNSTGGPNWSFNDGWLTDNPNWYGVNITWSEATSSHVTGLYLNYNGLTGTIPSSLGNLTELQNLDLSSNQLTGTIPTELGNLTSLEWLNLDDNQLTGTIPTQLGNLTNLEDLDLGYNQLTSGTIPTWLQNLTNLQWLGLCSDQLTGTIPTWFGNLTNLEWLDLSDNQLTGTIPSSLGNLTSLIGLYLGDNHLTGTIPSSLGNLTELQNLDLSSNQLTGTIPTELGNLTSLEWLNLDDNQLTGTIPTQLGNLTNLEDLDLGYNQLTSGTIPTWLQNLTNLQWLGLCSDQLTGTIPTWFGNLTNLEWLDLSDNQLTGTIPSSLGNLTSLIGLYLGDNHLTGTIPSALGSLDQLWYLGLGGNQLSGTIPSSLANLTSLELLELNGNQLTGEIPASLADLADLEPNYGWTDLSYNGLSASGSTLPPFLSTEFPGWDQTQTIPPTNVSAISRSAGSVKVFWTPILYTSDTGYYEVGISPASGGPYTPSGRTGNKSATSIIVTGLPVGSMQYVVVRTATLPNANNQNTLTSLWSTEVPVAVSDSTGGNANVVYVDCDSPTDGPGTNWSNAFRTVTAGLNAATSSGEVWVAKGTYTECITLTAGVGLYGGFAGTETALSQRNWNTNITILDGNQSGTVVTVPSNATQTMCIDGFTIRNGNGYYGGGIYCYYSSPTISNNTITGNSSADGGGGIYCDSSSPTITNNTIANNSTTKDGGGVECDSGSPIITKNTITANSAGDIGGGISAEDYCAATISNNIITGNSSSTAGGGISAWECSPTIADNTITGNSAYYGGGGISCDYYASPAITNNTITGNSSTYYGAIASIIATYYGGGILCIDSSSPVISNNIVVFNSSGMYNGAMTGDSPGTPDLGNNDVYGNTAYNYAGITDPTGVSGNISADPLFANPTGGNYRLSAGSPCIDTGTNTVVMSPPFLTNSSGVIIDLDGNPRIADGTVDMGAYEYFLDVTITSPTTASTYITNSSTIVLEGTASAVAGIAQVTWSDSAGGSGVCAGTTSWSTPSISLQPGDNNITITATDSAGNWASSSLLVILPMSVPSTDAVSREVSVLNSPQQSIALTDAVSREVSVLNSPPQSIALTDAVSREVSVLNSPQQSIALTDAVSREVSVLNSPQQSIAPTDAISREVSVLNSPQQSIALTDAVSREVSINNNLSAGYTPSDAVSREVSVLNGTVSPKTTITSPAEGFLSCDGTVTFQFTGVDEVTPTNQLQYQWSIDGGVWSAFSSSTSAALTGLAQGAHKFEVAALNAQGNVDPTPAVCDFSVDTLVPTVFGIFPITAANQVNVTWISNKPCTSQVDYGSDTNYGTTTPLDTNLATTHTVTINGLTTNATYHFRVKSEDECSREAVSTDQIFVTLTTTTPPSTRDHFRP